MLHLLKYFRVLFCLFLVTLFGVCHGQPSLTRYDSVKVFSGGNRLKNPWAGGLNFTEWSSIDLNFDGYKDIIVYDKSGQKLRTFLNDKISGTASYTHAPEFQDKFPAVDAWCIFYDYNCDNKPDLFTYSTGNGGIKVYKNTSIPGNVQFTYVKNYLKSNYNPSGSPQNYNLYCSQVAIPGLADVDGDTDMDVLSFSTSGITIQYHKNLSMELYGKCDSLVFDMVDECWGDVDENTCVVHLNSTLVGCPPYHKYKQAINAYNNSGGIRHAGSCLMCYDADGDKDIDLVMGDISCDSIEFFRNAGTQSYSHIDSVSKVFPAKHVATFKQFPCSYFLDLDNDNKRDLIVSPNITASENFQSVWQYTNMGQDDFPDFQFVKKNFLQEGMIELGEGAFPAAFDYEGDGDLDLLVGNFGYYMPSGTGNYSSRLALYLNTGTPSKPEFTLQTNDFQNFSTVNIINKTPALGDFDNDGDMDLFLGSYDGRLSYYTNTSGSNAPANFVLSSDYSMNGTFLHGIDVGNSSAPFVVDVDRDGMKDLIVGGKDGYISYYRNTGTAANPSLSLVNNRWGGVRTIQQGYSIIGNAMPFLFDEAGVYKLLVGSERGYVYLYGNIESNINTGNFTLIDSTYVNDLVEGQNVAPCLTDFNNDGFKDLILGNYSGGLAYFKGDENMSSINAMKDKLFNLSIYPNPVATNLTVKFDDYNLEQKELFIVDELGRQVKSLKTNLNNFEWNIADLCSGIYFLEIHFKGMNGKFAYNKFIKE